jgi:mono/diheme cytochrome c family protein
MLKRIIAISAISAGILGLVISLGSPLSGISAQGKNKNERGRKLYVEYCASCHGLDGKGGGPVASSLKTPLADLTTITQRLGKFDQVHIQNVISGDKEVAAHGTKEMPVWGHFFRQKSDQSVSTLNVFALATYLKSIQQQ